MIFFNTKFTYNLRDWTQAKCSQPMISKLKPSSKKKSLWNNLAVLFFDVQPWWPGTHYTVQGSSSLFLSSAEIKAVCATMSTYFIFKSLKKCYYCECMMCVCARVQVHTWVHMCVYGVWVRGQLSTIGSLVPPSPPVGFLCVGLSVWELSLWPSWPHQGSNCLYLPCDTTSRPVVSPLCGVWGLKLGPSG